MKLKMLLASGMVAVCILTFSQPVLAAEAKLYASLLFGEGVSVVDPLSLDAWGFIKTGRETRFLKATPDGAYVFVAIEGEDKVKVIDTASDKVVGTMDVGSRPRSMDVSPDGSYLVVGNIAGRSVSVVDTKTLKETRRIDTKGAVLQLRVSSDGKYTYAAMPDQELMQVIDMGRLEVKAETAISKEVSWFDLSVSGDKIYLNAETEGRISVMDSATLEVVKTIKGGKVDGIAVSPDGRYLWIGGPGDNLTVYSLAEDKPVAELPRDAHTNLFLVFSHDGKTVYAGPAGIDQKSIYVYDAVKMKKIGEARLDGFIAGMAYVEKRAPAAK